MAANIAETVLVAIAESGLRPAPHPPYPERLVAGLQAQLDMLQRRLAWQIPIVVDEQGRLDAGGEVLARLVAELSYVVTRYGWLAQVPPAAAEAFAGDVTRLYEAAHQMREAAGRATWKR